MEDDSLALHFKEPVVTSDELDRRESIDHLIAKVHESHRWLIATPNQASLDRQRILQQYVRLLEEHPDRPTRLGEILVTFYTFDLELFPSRKDAWSGDGDEADDSDGEPDVPMARVERSTYVDIPLQYLYNISGEGHAPEMHLSNMPLQIRPKTNTSGSLRVIEFPTNYYAADFLKVMKPELSLDELINSSKTTAIKHSKRSKFLTGVSHHPRVFYPVYSSNPKLPNISSKPKTLLFVSIPYLGHEPLRSAYIRRNPPPDTYDDSSQDMVDPEIKRLTAYHQLDSLRAGLDGEPSWNSSLSLFEYRFPSQSDTMVFDERQTVLNMGGANEEAVVVHQAWFMVFDNETIAAFRSPNDVQPEHAPLFPNYRMAHGAYHGLFNMIASILPSSEFKILHLFQERVSELEFSVQSNPYGDNGLTLRLNTVRTELSTIIHVVENQVQVLTSIKKFFIHEHREQFRIMYENIDQLIMERKDFCSQVEAIVRDVEASQQLLFQLLSMNKTLQHHDTAQDTVWQHPNTAKDQNTIIERPLGESTKEAGRQSTRPLVMQAQTQSQAESLVQAPEERASGIQANSLLVIAVLLAVFLPLSFFTSYYGMNTTGIRAAAMTERDFWKICGPASACIALFTLALSFRQELFNRFRKLLRRYM